MVPGIAWVAEKRPLRRVPLARVAVTSRCSGASPGPAHRGRRHRHDANLQLAALRLWRSALSFWLAGYMLRRHADDVPARIVDPPPSSSPCFSSCTRSALRQRRRSYTWGNELAETALGRLAPDAVLIGLERVRLVSGSVIHDWGARLLAAILLVVIGFRLGVNANPWVMGDPVGRPSSI